MTDIVSSDLTGILLQYGDDTPINITALQVQEGDNTPVAVWAEEYTLSITKTNPGYIKSAIVNRTASQYGHGATGELSNGATLYYGDTLTAAATAADTTTSYTEWVPAAIADPTFTNKTDTSVQVNNPNAFAVTLYYKLSTASSYTSVAIAASSNTTLSGLTAGSEYEFYFTASKSRTKTVTTYSVTKSWASLTVDSNESITFTGAASPVESTESSTLTSNTASYTMPYKITLTKNANVASISLTYTKVGASSRTTVRTAGTYYAEALSYFNWSATAVTGYVLDHSSGQSWIVNECTIAPIASRQTFTITFALGGSNYGSWSTASIAVEYGDTISRSGNTVTIKKWDDASANRGTSTFTNGSTTGYDYSVSYNDITSPITADQTVTATTSRTRKTFTITFALGGSNYGSWSKSSITAQYGDTISQSGNTVTVYKWNDTSTARDSSKFTNGSAAEYTYSVSYNTPTSPITAAQTITATTSRSRKKFLITFAKTGTSDSAWNSSTAITAEYGDYIQLSGSTVTVYKWDATSTARETRTFNNGTNAAYTYGTATYTNAPTTKTQLNISSIYAVSVAQDWTRKSFTITFDKDGHSNSVWKNSSGTATTSVTAYYGDWIQRSGNVVTIYKWDADSTARHTMTFSNSSNPDTIWYNANAPTTKTQLNRSTAYSLSCVTGWKITFINSSNNGTWYRNSVATTDTLMAYYGDKVEITRDTGQTSDSNATVTIYVGTSTTIRDTYPRIFKPSTGYHVTSSSAVTTVTGRHTIDVLATVNTYTITVWVRGSYLANYNGTITVKNGSTTVWSKSMNGVTESTTYTISTKQSYGTVLTTTVPNYTSGSLTYSGNAAPASLTVTSDYEISVAINRRTCSTCNAATTCGSSSSCTGCSSTTTCGSSSRGSTCSSVLNRKYPCTARCISEVADAPEY